VSAQLIEIIFLAGIAFFIISKFISLLGTTNEDDPAKNRSFFGEASSMKDVTDSTPSESPVRQKKQGLNSIIKIAKKIKRQEQASLEELRAVFSIFPNFNPEKFLIGSKSAFAMIIEALGEKDLETIEELVDKRFLDQVKNMHNVYGRLTSKEVDASIKDSYSLGQAVYVKVLFKGKTSKVKSLKEEWVFTKNVGQSGPDWYLSNIDR
jgi:predicted lipid-binding transport protein (Tim44 family)